MIATEIWMNKTNLNRQDAKLAKEAKVFWQKTFVSLAPFAPLRFNI